MEYRKLGNTGLKTSILGMGCMRLPVIDNEETNINRVEASKMFDYAIDHGVNAFDTAYVYHSDMVNIGDSPLFLGDYMEERGCRKDIILSTKLPSFSLTGKEGELDEYLNRELEALKTDYVDVYFLHNVDSETWKIYEKDGLFDFMDETLLDGRVKHWGISFHREPELLDKMLDSSNKFEVVLTQNNYLDDQFDKQAPSSIVKKHNLGNYIMEPLRGGTLANGLPESALKIIEKYAPGRSPVELAFKYLYQNPDYTTIFSGMNSLEQVKENISIAEDYSKNPLKDSDFKVLEDVASNLYKLRGNPCTYCGYCMPCPNNVNIRGCFREYNTFKIIGREHEQSDWRYFGVVFPGTRADECTGCEDCLSKCPQGIDIPTELEKVTEFFGPSPE